MKLFRFAFAALLVAAGLVLLPGGASLIAAGGSPYYVLAGSVLALCGVAVAIRHRHAARLYGLLLVATLLWSVAEVGLNPWGHLSRLGVLVALGAGFLLPTRTGRRICLAVLLAAVATVVALSLQSPSRGDSAAWNALASDPAADWPFYGNDKGGTRFSGLGQITPENVNGLRVAWTYRVGPASDGSLGNFEAAPLKIDDTIYLCSNANVVHALDAETGLPRWHFDPKPALVPRQAKACRGVAYYKVPDATGPCATRIITATVDARLWAVDATDGKPCADFGRDGQVDLRVGMGQYTPGYYYVSSAPTIVSGRIVVGGWVTDNQALGAPPGVVRGFDAVTGAFAWAWDIGNPGVSTEPPPGRTYTLATPNAWGPMSGDEELGLVYLPTGNATPDYYGAGRSVESDRFSSSVVALDAATGALRWSFQTVHHDLWDYDVPAQPTLVDLRGKDGTLRPALIQSTKQGQIFVLDRRDGKPIVPVKERPVPQDGAPGERVSPTQPASVGFPSFEGPHLTEAAMWGLTPLDQLWCRIKFAQARYDGPMTPPGLRSTVESPGFMGAINWGGVSVDPERQLLVVNANRMPTYHRLIPRAEADAMGIVVRTADSHGPNGHWAQAGTPFAASGSAFLSPLGVPCNRPPYGTLTAVDLATGQVAWEQPLGSMRDSGPLGIRSGLPITIGVPNMGSSTTTRSGLTFISATQDPMLRAFATSTGKLLWEDRLPAGGQATPVTYLSKASGRQFVVIAAGGKSLLQSPLGDYVVAYALPAP